MRMLHNLDSDLEISDLEESGSDWNGSNPGDLGQPSSRATPITTRRGQYAAQVGRRKRSESERVRGRTPQGA